MTLTYEAEFVSAQGEKTAYYQIYSRRNKGKKEPFCLVTLQGKITRPNGEAKTLNPDQYQKILACIGEKYNVFFNKKENEKAPKQQEVEKE